MVDVSRVNEILERHGAKRERMIAILLDCQEEYYYLPREVLEAVAAGVKIPLTSVLAIATFFKAFSLKPIGRHPIRVCNGTACNIQGGPLLVDALERELKIKKGETTPDDLFGLDTRELRRMLRSGARHHGRTGCARKGENSLRAEDGQAIPAESSREAKGGRKCPDCPLMI